MTIPKFYLKNKEILEEIHLSKVSYCSFLNNETDSRPDAYLLSKDDINQDTIRQAKLNRANRLNKIKKDTIEDPESIADTDVVFRIATWEHIPLALPKAPKNPPKKRNLTELFDFDDLDGVVEEPVAPPQKKHVRLNFPPFHHYRVNEFGVPYLVGKSHWKGPLDGGEFGKDHGRISELLARMFITMTERYSTRGNWRSYTYVDEMRGAAIIALVGGALAFDESKGSNPFSFYTTCITNAFTGYLLTERKNQNIRDDILEMNGMNPSFTRQYANSYNFAGKHGPVEIIKYNQDGTIDEQPIQESDSIHGHSFWFTKQQPGA